MSVRHHGAKQNESIRRDSTDGWTSDNDHWSIPAGDSWVQAGAVDWLATEVALLATGRRGRFVRRIVTANRGE